MILMKKLQKLFFLLFVTIISATLFSCSSDDDDDYSSKGHDATLYGEWVANDGKYSHDYYSFYSDGTGIHGSYESKIDMTHEDEDFKWYTEDCKYLYIDGAKYEYSCDGTSLYIKGKSTSKTYHEK